MGVPWHRQEERKRKEWVVYGAAGVVLLIVAGAITLGVVLGGKSKGDSQQATANGSSAPPATVGASPPPLAVPVPSPSPSPSPAAAPTVPSPTPGPAAASPAPAVSSPAPVTASPTPVAASPPAAATPTPSPTPAGSTGSTYDASMTAVGIVGAPEGVTPPESFKQLWDPAAEGKAGTCEFNTGEEKRCRDDMDIGATTQTPIEELNIMWDATQMESCGFTDVSTIVNGLIKWAYKGKCGVDQYTVNRACVGKTDGSWRMRVMLWPVAGGDPEACVPLCIKMRGQQGQVTDYGRTASC